MDFFQIANLGRGLTWKLSDLVVENFFNYTPSTALAAIALALYTIAAAVVAYQTWKSKWHFVYTVSITGVLEAAGYAALLAAISLSGKTNIYGAYVSMQVFVILSPNLLQGTAYWTVGNLLAASPDITRGKRLLGRTAVTTIFASSDLIALMVQSIGISIWAKAKSSPSGTEAQVRLGSEIMLAGLAVQLICYILFSGLAIWVHRHPKNAIAGSRNLRKLYLGLYLNIIFLSIRNIYRFVEFTQSTILGWPYDPDAYVLAEQQVLFYTLDTLPILLCFAAFIRFHPGWYLPYPAKGDVENGSAASEEDSMDSKDMDKLSSGSQQAAV